MGLINHRAPRRLLAIARGHPYERESFLRLFDTLDEFDVCLAEQPAASALMCPETAKNFDVLVCYDMPGIDFGGPDPPELLAPDPIQIKQYRAMLETGIGIVYLHHAIAAWPTWDSYAEIVGGRFHYRASVLHDRPWPDSGYRHKVSHTLHRVGNHPVTRGLPDRFTMTDELYLFPVLEDRVVPLLRSDYDFLDSNFYSAAAAVAGKLNDRENWSHPDGSSLVGWANAWGASPLVYLQGGDDAEALENAFFKTLVGNAVRWVGSAEASRWARDRTAAAGEDRAEQ
ncbi:MAG: ThuA domain-containing protein [Pseudomonadota bacterium]